MGIGVNTPSCTHSPLRTNCPVRVRPFQSDGFTVERDHLVPLIVLVGVDRLGYDKARCDTVDRISRKSSLRGE